MGEKRSRSTGNLSSRLGCLFRFAVFHVLSVGPIPSHIALIMDGNRRYAKMRSLGERDGHKAGFTALMSILKYCYELGIKYTTIYAFSIDNFKRRPEEVQSIMDLMLEKIEGLLKEDSIVNQYGVRVHFIGNLRLLDESVRVAAEKAMAATAKHSERVLLICIAYASSDEIVHSVQESCRDKWDQIKNLNSVRKEQEDEVQPLVDSRGIKLVDIEKHMYMSVAPDPDIVIRTSGEMRLSNFLLWQTNYSLLYSPKALWPEIGLWHLVWAILNYQRNYSYLEKKKKQL